MPGNDWRWDIKEFDYLRRLGEVDAENDFYSGERSPGCAAPPYAKGYNGRITQLQREQTQRNLLKPSTPPIDLTPKVDYTTLNTLLDDDLPPIGSLKPLKPWDT